MESGQAGQLVSSGRDIKPNFADRFNSVTKREICRMRFGTKSRLIVGGEEFVAETALRIPGGFGGKMAKVDSDQVGPRRRLLSLKASGMSSRSSRIIMVRQLPLWNKDMSVVGMHPRLVSGCDTLWKLFLYVLPHAARQVESAPLQRGWMGSWSAGGGFRLLYLMTCCRC